MQSAEHMDCVRRFFEQWPVCSRLYNRLLRLRLDFRCLVRNRVPLHPHFLEDDLVTQRITTEIAVIWNIIVKYSRVDSDRFLDGKRRGGMVLKRLFSIILLFIVLIGCGKVEPTVPGSIDHPAEFDPSLVKEGDSIAGLKVKSIRTGDDPLHYVLVDLEGELAVSGYYYRTGQSVAFQPDLASLKNLPHVKNQYARHYRDGTKVSRLTRFMFDDQAWLVQIPADSGTGRATVVLSDYKVQYIPEANTQMTDSVLIDGQSYLKLGEELVPFGFRYVEDAAKPVRMIDATKYHYLKPPKGTQAQSNEQNQFVWKDLRVRLDMMADWNSAVDKPNYAALMGNHASLVKTDTLHIPGIGTAYLMVVERDRWDMETNYYNGFEYEYWIITLREDPMVRMAGDDYLHAFCLIGVSDQQSETAESNMRELASLWQVPPEDFYSVIAVK